MSCLEEVMRRLCFILMLAALGCTRTESTTSQAVSSPAVSAPAAVTPAPSAAGTAELTAVDPSLVCMINDQFMGKAQIPVIIEGRTYFGCCPMCKQKLEASAEARSAIDPVSGRPVDKARAVIGRRADGSVLYFESAETLARYGRS